MCKTNRSGKAAILSRNQLELMWANLPRKYALLAQTMYVAAGRVTEIVSLKVKNINFVDCLITIEKSATKTKSTRAVPISMPLAKELEAWTNENNLDSESYIFFTESKNAKYRKGAKHVSSQSVDQFFRKAFDWTGIVGGSTHSLRRSRLTHLHIDEKWSLREIMDISGHSSIMSLQQYLDADRVATFDKYRSLLKREADTL
jgi:integrase/recombinase XerD